MPTGTILGRLGERVPTMRFQIRPAVRGALPVDPKPILDGWRLLDRSGPRSVAWRNSLVGPRARWRSIGQILLMRKDALVRRVLSNRRVELYACGRDDVRTGLVDRRVLAALEYLAASGLEPTVTSLRCGHSRLTAGGRVSYHASGNAVDIAAINGVPIMGHQGPGSITDIAVRRLLTLQGDMRPDEIISLMTYADAPNALRHGRSRRSHTPRLPPGPPDPRRLARTPPLGALHRPPGRDQEPDGPRRAVTWRPARVEATAVPHARSRYPLTNSRWLSRNSASVAIESSASDSATSASATPRKP